MARPAVNCPEAHALRALVRPDGVIAVCARPGARSASVQIDGDLVLIKVRERAEGGKANAAIRLALAKAMGVAPSRLDLIRGASGREKQFKLSD